MISKPLPVHPAHHPSPPRAGFFLGGSGSLSARTYIAEGMAPGTVQTLLGHAHAEMTAVYLNDRGLTEAEWKAVEAMPA